MVKRVLFLMSDTGGGHRAAAEAIRDALYLRYGQNAVNVKLVDVYREMTFPMNYMPELYPWIVNNSKSSWGMGYNLSNTPLRATMLSKSMYLTNGHRLRRMARQNPADVVVSVLSVITRPSMTAYRSLGKRPPFVSVVTDLVSTHMFWYDRRVESCLVPTQAAYERGLMCGLKPDQLQVTGLPVHPHFQFGLQDEADPRQELGLDAHLPTVLLVAGGEGMGPLFETARAINDKNLPCQLVIVTGRNAALKAKLESSLWNQPTHIFGFVDNMPTFMKAADILVTKAGPATICEAAMAGLPMILSDAIPGQETGNVDHVIEHGAGVYAPNPYAVAEAVRSWLKEGDAGLRRRAEAARQIARPNAVWDIAEEVWRYAHMPPILSNPRKLIKEQRHLKREIPSLWN